VASSLLLAVAMTIAAPWALASHCEPQQVGAGRRIDIELQDAEIKSVLRLFAEIGRVNIIPRKGVSGRVTASLRNIPWDDALRAILRAHRLGMIWQGNVIYVAPVEELERPPSRR
jgi:type IV pilus assembly protein PilQ